MKLVDLVALYRKKSWHPNIHIHPDEEAGIRAVVAALRDEMAPERLCYDGGNTEGQLFSFQEIRDLFNEILGDAVEAAGGPTREDGRTSGGVHSLPVDGQPTPAADVCPYCGYPAQDTCDNEDCRTITFKEPTP